MNLMICKERKLIFHIPSHIIILFKRYQSFIAYKSQIGNSYQRSISFITKNCSSTPSLFAHHTTAWCCRFIAVAAISGLSTNAASRWTSIIVGIYPAKACHAVIVWAFRRGSGRSDARISWPVVTRQWLWGLLIYTRIIVISQETPFLAVVLTEMGFINIH